jgi:hypothetical protein
MKRLDKNYISNLDKFLHNTRQQIPTSAAQAREMAQYNDIFQRRDHPNDDEKAGILNLDE